MSNSELADPTAALWDLPESLRSMVEAELDLSEKIAWIGRPRGRRSMLKALPLVLFGIPWTAFVLFWIAGAAGFGLPDFNDPFDFFPLFGTPFLLVGIGLLTSPLWIAWNARRTVYVVTNRRAILFEGGLSTTVRSYGPECLKSLQRSQRRDGSGDLVFERELSLNTKGYQVPRLIGMFGIPDVRNVERLMRDLWAPSPDRAF